MKKNITINLCGRLFAIDEDAYEMLSTYEQSLRNYFRSREGGEEIAEDIEARIAELLDELKQSGTEAITIDHVREIIHRIGKPEEISPSTEGPTPDPSRQGGETSGLNEENSAQPRPSLTGGGGGGSAVKRLYRNPDDKKLMGVLSGFAAYFGGDVLWWRLGYVGLFLLTWAVPYIMPITIIRFVVNNGRFDYTTSIFLNSLLLIFLYVVFAALMPVAETPEDRLRMKGKEVNPRNLAEEVAPPQPSQKDEVPGHKGPSGCIGCIGGFFVALWTVITTLFRWCLYAFGAFVAVMCLVGIFMLTVVAFNPISSVFSNSFMQSPEFAAILPELKGPFFVFFICAVLVLAITAYAIIHSLLNEFKQMPSMPYRQRVTLLIIWFAGLIGAGAALASRWMLFIDADNAYHKRWWEEYDARYREEHTHDGIYIQSHEWEWLQDNGWKILNAEGCNDRFTTTGQYLTGDHNVRYLDCYDDHHRQRYRAERTETLQPGTYRLSCVARANGTGACIYVIVGDEKPQFVEIPATGNEGGNIWEEAKRPTPDPSRQGGETSGKSEGDSAQPHPSLTGEDGGGSVEVLLQANGGKGFGWNRIVIEPIRITTPTVIRYGLTSDDYFTGKTWLGQWFSATDFEVSLCENGVR